MNITRYLYQFSTTTISLEQLTINEKAGLSLLIVTSEMYTYKLYKFLNSRSTLNAEDVT